MLRELRETTEDNRRRWFSDDYFDLIVWYDEGRRATGFQLCYDKQGKERAFTWKNLAGASHNRVDDGEASPYENMSPVLVPDGVMPYDEIQQQFASRAKNVEQDIYNLVMQKLEEHRTPSHDNILMHSSTKRSM